MSPMTAASVLNVTLSLSAMRGEYQLLIFNRSRSEI